MIIPHYTLSLAQQNTKTLFFVKNERENDVTRETRWKNVDKRNKIISLLFDILCVKTINRINL